jgi:uncharacterized membrane protein
MYSNKTKALLVATCVSVIMLSVRIINTGSLNYIFLAWNIILAWVPYMASGLIPLVGRRPTSYGQQPTSYSRRPTGDQWKTGLLLAVWLLFLPNAPYIITDFVHLRHRAPVPIIFDATMLLLFSLTGLALGLLSIQHTENWWRQHRPHIAVPQLRFFVFLLCGFGIYLGRVERWNSWDIISNPGGLLVEVMKKIIDPFSNVETWAVTILFALLLWVTYRILKMMPEKSR